LEIGLLLQDGALTSSAVFYDFTLIASLRLMHRYGCHKLGHAQNISNLNNYTWPAN